MHQPKDLLKTGKKKKKKLKEAYFEILNLLSSHFWSWCDQVLDNFDSSQTPWNKMNIQSLQHLSQPVSNLIMPSVSSVVGNPYTSWQYKSDFQPVHIILSSSNPCLHQQSMPEINLPDVDTGKYPFRKLESVTPHAKQ